jgi:hypothetical protein
MLGADKQPKALNTTNQELFSPDISYSNHPFSQLARPFAVGAKTRLAFRPTSRKKVPIILVIAGQSLDPNAYLDDQLRPDPNLPQMAFLP